MFFLLLAIYYDGSRSAAFAGTWLYQQLGEAVSCVFYV
jgi:hypothetical protein